MGIFTKAKPPSTTEFSRFIREASAGEKKRVYSDVIKRATERQQAVTSKPVRSNAR